MTCDAEWRSLTISSSAFVGNFAASISSWVVGMWRAIVKGLCLLMTGASARALRRTPASNMARRIGVGGRLEQRLCSLPVSVLAS